MRDNTCAEMQPAQRICNISFGRIAGNVGCTILAGSISIAGLGEQVKACDWREVLLRAFDDIAQLGVDKVGDAKTSSLQACKARRHPESGKPATMVVFEAP